jgi:hypothetical protein
VRKFTQKSYPETVVSIFESLMKSVGVGAVPMNEKEEDWVGNFMLQLHSKVRYFLSDIIVLSSAKMQF